MNCGSGSACRKRLAQWQRPDVWDRLHQVLLAHLREAEKLNWERDEVDSASVQALEGGEETGKNPTDRAKKGSKHHVLSDGRGTPLSTRLTGANRHDSTQLLPVVEGIASVPIAGAATIRSC